MRGACLVLSISAQNDRMKGLGNATSTVLVVASLRVYKVKRQTCGLMWGVFPRSLGDIVFPQGTVSRDKCFVFLYSPLLLLLSSFTPCHFPNSSFFFLLLFTRYFPSASHVPSTLLAS